MLQLERHFEKAKLIFHSAVDKQYYYTCFNMS